MTRRATPKTALLWRRPVSRLPPVLSAIEAAPASAPTPVIAVRCAAPPPFAQLDARVAIATHLFDVRPMLLGVAVAQRYQCIVTKNWLWMG